MNEPGKKECFQRRLSSLWEIERVP